MGKSNSISPIVKQLSIIQDGIGNNLYSQGQTPSRTKINLAFRLCHIQISWLLAPALQGSLSQ
jgi:hypothetical protein